MAAPEPLGDLIARRDPDTARMLRRAAGSSSSVRLDRARSGEISAAVTRPEGGTLRLHSRYDPRREAERRLAELPAAATLVVYGLGAAWLPRLILEQRPRASVLVFEPEAAAVNEVLASPLAEDLRPALSTGRLRIVCEPRALGRAVEETHQPALATGLAAYLLPGRFSPSAEPLLREAQQIVSAALGSAMADTATMQRSALSWFTHALETSLNGRAAALRAGSRRLAELISTRAHTAVVVGAGPSLDARPDAEIHPPGAVTVAVDTAVPALQARGIVPELVVSLDSQGWSALHLRHRLPPSVLVVADLGASWAVTREAESVLTIVGGHPLHRLLLGSGFPAALLHAPTGNVTMAALMVARRLAPVVSVLGADGGYPGAATYARGTYHHRWAAGRASRRNPVEQQFAARVYPLTGVPRDDGTGRPLFTSAAMESTGRRLRAAAGEQPPDAPALDLPDESHGADDFDACAFWTGHRQELVALRHRIPTAPCSTPELLARLGPHGMAHLPLAAAAAAGRLPAASGGLEPLHAALEWVLRYLDRRLDPERRAVKKGFPFGVKDR